MPVRLPPQRVESICALARQGLNDQQISVDLGINRAAVWTVRTRHGIPASKARNPRRPAETLRRFTADDDKLLLIYRDDLGWTWDRIRIEMGRTAIKTVQQRYFSLHARQPGKKAKRAAINCLCCGNPFFSPDRIRIRMCTPCKTGSLVSGLDEHGIA
jgi:hypothetical protein